MIPSPSTEEGGRADRLLRSIKRTQWLIAAAYAYDTAILFGYHAAGYVEFHVPVVIGGLLGLLVAIVNCAHRTGWSAKRKDPTLFLPQQLCAIAIALIAAILAPSIGFQPLATLIAISAFSFMAPNQLTLIWSWIATAFATSAVIVVAGPELAIPTGTIAGRVLTCAVMLGVLARCIWVAVFIHRLQRRVREKNKALQVAFQRIEVMANRDELTGLPNRRAILSTLAEQIALARRADLPLSIALIDIDHFKLINDHYGHLAGDRALQIFSELASTVIRVSDRLGRYGGEEFLLVMPATRLEETEVPLERIRQRIAKWDWSAIDAGLRLTLTIGVSEYAEGDSSGELVRRADVALYLGKEAGRDRIVLDRCQLPKLQATSANLRMASAEGFAT